MSALTPLTVSQTIQSGYDGAESQSIYNFLPIQDINSNNRDELTISRSMYFLLLDGEPLGD